MASYIKNASSVNLQAIQVSYFAFIIFYNYFLSLLLLYGCLFIVLMYYCYYKLYSYFNNFLKHFLTVFNVGRFSFVSLFIYIIFCQMFLTIVNSFTSLYKLQDFVIYFCFFMISKFHWYFNIFCRLSCHRFPLFWSSGIVFFSLYCCYLTYENYILLCFYYILLMIFNTFLYVIVFFLVYSSFLVLVDSFLVN